MSDEIDIESARLERLNTQRMKRISQIIDENADIEHKAVNVQKTKKYIFPEAPV